MLGLSALFVVTYCLFRCLEFVLSFKSRLRPSFGVSSLLLLLVGGPLLYAASAGLPFTEDFQSDALNDDETILTSLQTTANWTDGAGAVYLTDGDLAMSAVGSTQTDADDTNAVVLGDIDQDGYMDLIAGNDGLNRIYSNTGGNDVFPVNGIDIGADTDDTQSLALGDLDGDGDLDLVAGNNGANKVYYYDSGSDTFPTSGSGIGISDNDNTQSVALGDVDNDGDLDLITGNNGLNKLYLYDSLNNTFPDSGTVVGIADTDDTREVVLADMNNDENLDLVVANYGTTNKLYLNSGGNGFLSAVNIGSIGRNTRGIAVGDIDNDGDNDVVSGDESGSQANQVFLNNGSGGFPVSGSDVGVDDKESTSSIYLSDYNGDGFLDVIVGNSGHDNRRYINNGDGTFPDGGTVFGATASTSSLAAGDLDGDGDHDLVVGNFGAANSLDMNLNGGSFSPVPEAIGSETDNTRGIVLVDVDIANINGPDLVVANLSATNKVYFNDGSGSFDATGTDIGVETDQSHAIVAADVDNDGDNDLIVANSQPAGNQTNKVYLNADGLGDFSGTPYDMGGGSDGSYAVATGLLNNDVYPDVVIGNYAQENRVYLNAGVTGVWNGFFAATDAGAETDNTRDVALEDVDLDGDPDLIIANEDETNKLYLNGGNSLGYAGAINPCAGVGGCFPTVVDLGSETERSFSVAVGDIDGIDGNDIVIGNVGAPNRYYLENGSGGFGTANTVGTDIDDTMRVILTDINNDGLLDLLAINYEQVNKLYINTGAGFSGIGVPVTADIVATPASFALDDIDGDGDVDLITGNIGQTNKLYRNIIFRTDAGRVVSIKVNDTETGILSAQLTATATANTDTSRNTAIDYYLSNNGGTKWHQVKSGQPFTFPSAGDDLRWKAELKSLSPILTPVLSEIQIEANRAPVISSNGGGDSAAISMGQNQPAVTTVEATDADNHTLSYSITGGVDASLFEIEGGSGEVSFLSAPDFGSPDDSNGDNVYHVDVRVTDNGVANLTDTQQISITITSNDASTPTAGGGGGGSALSHWLPGLLISLMLWRARHLATASVKRCALYH